MLWRVETTKLRLPWWAVAARVVERPGTDRGHVAWIVDLEEERFLWTVEAPGEAAGVLRLLPGVLSVEPMSDEWGEPGELVA